MTTVAVTVAHYTAKRLREEFGSVSKKALKVELADPHSNAEFVTIGGFTSRPGARLTVREAIDSNISMLEVRSDDHTRLIAAIYLKNGKADVK